MNYTSILIFSYITTLSLLLLFSCHGIIMVFYRYRSKSFKRGKLSDFNNLPFVTFQLPVYNEKYVIRRLLKAVTNMNYPNDKFEIQILDDSTDETTQIITNFIENYSDEISIKHIRRTDRSGFKAGALAEGIKSAKGEFIAIFDADFIPNKNFLQKTLPYFSNDKIGMVQTRWSYLNENYSFLTKIQALSLNNHFVIDQEVKNKSGFFISFNGTGGIWRKNCVLNSGNWQNNSLTEDLDLSLRAQIKGWKFVFLRDFSSPGELPAEMNSYKSQQFRWTKGTIETAKQIIPQLWKAKIPLRIKLQSTFQLLSNFSFPLIILLTLLNVPVIFLRNLLPEYFIFNIMSIFFFGLISSLIYFIYSQKDLYNNWIEKVFYFPLFIAGNIGLAVNNTKAVFEGIVNLKSDFVRTPKFQLVTKNDKIVDGSYLKGFKNNSLAIIELFLAFYSLIGVAASIYFNEIAALPFHFLFFIGFAGVSVLSFKDTLIKQKRG